MRGYDYTPFFRMVPFPLNHCPSGPMVAFGESEIVYFHQILKGFSTPTKVKEP